MRAKSMKMGEAEGFEHVQKPAITGSLQTVSIRSCDGCTTSIRPVTDLCDCQMHMVDWYQSSK